MKTLRKSLLSLFVLVICFVIPCIQPLQISAEDSSSPYIIDLADLLSDTEETELASMAKNYSEKKSVSIVVLTTDDTEGYSRTDYASAYYDQYIHDTDGYQNDCVLFLVDMQSRKTNIFAYENASKRMDTKRCDKILDLTTPELHDADYMGACKTYLQKANYYLGLKPGYDPDNIFFKLWFQLIIAAVIGAVVVGIMVFNSGGKVTTNAGTYLDQGHSKLTGCFDNYIRTTRTRTKKPDNNSSGGKTGGGSSFSSGHERGF